MDVTEQAKLDASTHAARRQSEMDRLAAMTPEERWAEFEAIQARIAALVNQPSI